MTTLSHRRLVNPRLGTYFGIFASVFVSLVLLLVIFEQLGASSPLLRWLMLLGPIVLYIAIGVAARCRDPVEFFASGRRVPAVYTGLVLACSAIGATGLVAITGLFFINGFDAWCLAIGFSAGFVLMALMIAPCLRKFGAYTIPSYLGRRFENRFLRVTSAAILAVPMMLVLMAELRMGAFAAAWLAGAPEGLMTLLLMLAVLAAVLLGGMRSLSWTNTAEAIATLLALMVPVAIVAALVTNLPLPQLSHGPVLRAIGRLEAGQGVPIQIAPALAFDFAGRGLEPLAHRIASTYGSVGPLSFILASLTLMTGVAAAPWLLPRCGVTPGVYEARKAIGWATLFCGVVMLTLASVAVFMRDIVMETLVGHMASEMPDWFVSLQRLGFAAVDGNAPRLPLGAFSFKRDAALFALPMAAGFPSVLFHLALAGAVAAALAGASAIIIALGNMLAEDVVSGLKWEPAPPRLRIALARISIAAVTVVVGWIAMLIPADPLDLMLWGFALSGSAMFPILVCSIWWKRLNAFGALVGITVGFAVAVLAILAGEAAWLGVPGPLAAVFGVPAGLTAAVIAAKLTPAPSRQLVEFVRDMRSPGGETMHDREMRLQRLKQRQEA